MLAILKELFRYLISSKKYFLIPLMVLLVLFAILFVVSQGTAISPFIYTIF